MIAQSISPDASISLSDLVGDAGELDALGQVELDLLDAARLVGAGLIPVDVLQRDALLVLHPAAHVDGGGVRPFRRTDFLALEILDGFDPALLVDVERARSGTAASRPPAAR